MTVKIIHTAYLRNVVSVPRCVRVYGVIVGSGVTSFLLESSYVSPKVVNFNRCVLHNLRIKS